LTRAHPKLFTLCLVIALACGNPEKSINNFSDPVILKIADLKDRRLPDSLYVYFGDPDPVYRREAVLAFASIQHSTEIDRIGKLLMMDSDARVRKAAAFALGQISHPACERLLLGALVKEKVRENTFEILQAYGKTTAKWKLDASVFLNDTLTASGLAWSIYRAGVRGKTDSMANAVAIRMLDTTFAPNVRLAAAHYFARGATGFQEASGPLITRASGDRSAEVRMAAALSLGKIPSAETLAALKGVIRNDHDTRVVINAIRALNSFDFDSTQAVLFESLSHKDHNVGTAASEVIRDAVTGDTWISVASQVNHISEWRLAANLYEGALRAGQHQDLATEIQTHYNQRSDPYERAALLASLKHYPASFEFVAGELRSTKSVIIRSGAASTLVAMNYSRNFTPEHKSRFVTLCRSILESQDDPAVIGSLAGALSDSTLGYRQLIKDPGFLYTAKDKLRMPEHIEALQPVLAAIAVFEGKPVPAVQNEFNHPIDWEVVKQIPADQRVTIKTTRGHIVMRLLVNESPGSVANFVTLALDNYFDDKAVHRVVPNFVIQTGCKRGDGWGSEDYSIRSEFSPRLYKAGSVGMASAGKDTEGTQWFITHSPTPHLDGRYTIFAEVIEGERAVGLLRVGDKITDVVIENFKAQ
jgi:cyclophilin family peptidyl-prolyl cis-trans isomerase/HEAT repeat protein